MYRIFDIDARIYTYILRDVCELRDVLHATSPRDQSHRIELQEAPLDNA